ncbi:hypothetical protein ZEAMMB73_Zm00001d000315 [Zea mays]|jgi:hypothetical protein|uniref:Uncharacterized protein n=1 Tax=Zea mays TaxID=4577 RepID=A0A804LPX1_MAIZE|nr:hypothetical protein ZEAMMB73_Zm00001d000315 [Zea mays]
MEQGRELVGGIYCAMGVLGAMGGASAALKNGARAMERRVEMLQSMDREPTALCGRGTGRAWLEEGASYSWPWGEKKGSRRGSFNSGALGCWAARRGQQREAPW